MTGKNRTVFGNCFRDFKPQIDKNFVPSLLRTFQDFTIIPHGVFWITRTWKGQILPPPPKSVISKDMDSKFGMLE